MAEFEIDRYPETSESQQSFATEPETISVFVRSRPITSKNKDVNEEQLLFDDKKYSYDIVEPDDSNPDDVVLDVENKTINIKKKHKFSFDMMLDGKTTQESAYLKTCDEMVNRFLRGYNISYLAYGQSGSGKTHTMFGPEKDEGIIFRAAQKIFKASGIVVEISIVQLYEDKLYDLESYTPFMEVKQKNIKLRPVENYDKFRQRVMAALEKRKTGSTKLNKYSSRGHMIITLSATIYGKRQYQPRAKFVDLCGSEDLRQSMVEGQQKKEATAINLSLSMLTTLIRSIIDRKKDKKTVIAWRGHPLTEYLYDCVSINCFCAFMICYNQRFASQTLNSMRFAARLKQVTIAPIKNEQMSYDELMKRYKQLLMDFKVLEVENKSLREELSKRKIDVKVDSKTIKEDKELLKSIAQEVKIATLSKKQIQIANALKEEIGSDDSMSDIQSVSSELDDDISRMSSISSVSSSSSKRMTMSQITDMMSEVIKEDSTNLQLVPATPTNQLKSASNLSIIKPAMLFPSANTSLTQTNKNSFVSNVKIEEIDDTPRSKNNGILKSVPKLPPPPKPLPTTNKTLLPIMPPPLPPTAPTAKIMQLVPPLNIKEIAALPPNSLHTTPSIPTYEPDSPAEQKYGADEDKTTDAKQNSKYYELDDYAKEGKDSVELDEEKQSTPEDLERQSMPENPERQSVPQNLEQHFFQQISMDKTDTISSTGSSKISTANSVKLAKLIQTTFGSTKKNEELKEYVNHIVPSKPIPNHIQELRNQINSNDFDQTTIGQSSQFSSEETATKEVRDSINQDEEMEEEFDSFNNESPDHNEDYDEEERYENDEHDTSYIPTYTKVDLNTARSIKEKAETIINSIQAPISNQDVVLDPEFDILLTDDPEPNNRAKQVGDASGVSPPPTLFSSGFNLPIQSHTNENGNRTTNSETKKLNLGDSRVKVTVNMTPAQHIVALEKLGKAKEKKMTYITSLQCWKALLYYQNNLLAKLSQVQTQLNSTSNDNNLQTKK